MHDGEPDTLVEVVAAERARWGGSCVVDELIYGTDEPEEVADQVSRWCRAVLGQAVTGGLFHAVSAGSVSGVVLEDGSRGVVKAYQPQCTRGFLAAVASVQRSLVADGIPCATPLVGPEPLGAGYATAETYLPDPGHPSRFGSSEMAASAEGLHHLVTAAPWAEDLRAHPMNDPDPGALYPRPHSPLFDFEATTAGAEWIDDIARQAVRGIGGGPEVVAHMDWSARNVRLRPEGVQAIYDIDSLSIAPLSMVLAGAAATWRSTGEPGEDAAPGVTEVEAWLECWPDHLAPAVLASTFASVAYHLAYASRCEHAIDADGRKHQRARPTLRREGTTLLERAGLA